VIKKEAEISLKYTDFTIETQRMWNLKTTVTPVIIEETGAISNSFRKFSSNIVGKDEIKELKRKVKLALQTCFGN
jgi:hypothetical protein